MKKEIINTENAPKAIGPYSQGVKTDSLIFTSGQLPINPKTNKIISDDIKKATEQSLLNIKAILEEARSDMSKILKATIYLKNLDDFADMNEAYETFFKDNPPARSAFQVAKLPLDAIIEIEVIASI